MEELWLRNCYSMFMASWSSGLNCDSKKWLSRAWENWQIVEIVPRSERESWMENRQEETDRETAMVVFRSVSHRCRRKKTCSHAHPSPEFELASVHRKLPPKREPWTTNHIQEMWMWRWWSEERRTTGSNNINNGNVRLVCRKTHTHNPLHRQSWERIRNKRKPLHHERLRRRPKNNKPNPSRRLPCLQTVASFRLHSHRICLAPKITFFETKNPIKNPFKQL